MKIKLMQGHETKDTFGLSTPIKVPRCMYIEIHVPPGQFDIEVYALQGQYKTTLTNINKKVREIFVIENRHFNFLYNPLISIANYRFINEGDVLLRFI
jgi:hypothetical protein